VYAEDIYGAESGQSCLAVVIQIHDDDEDAKEVGVWALSDLGEWWWSEGDLPEAVPAAQRFYDGLVSQGFTGRYTLFNEANVWKEQFQDPRFEYGGADDIYVDSCDFIYINTHGDCGCFVVGTTPYLQTIFVNFDYRVSWGDQDMEWAFITACDMLERYAYGEDLWEISSCFGGKLHGIAGYATIEYVTGWDGYYAPRYATGQEYVPGRGYTPLTIGEAWEYATTRAQNNANVTGAIVAAGNGGSNYEDEYLPGYCSGMFPDPNSTNWQDLHGHWWVCE